MGQHFEAYVVNRPIFQAWVEMGRGQISGPHLCWWEKQMCLEEAMCHDDINALIWQVVAWEYVYATLHSVLCLFQLWACKQAMHVAATNKNLHQIDALYDLSCPSCDGKTKSWAHILRCREARHTNTLNSSIRLLDCCLLEVGTDYLLRRCIVEFGLGQRCRLMAQVATTLLGEYVELASSQDNIRWVRFMEGMISWEMIEIQRSFVTTGHCRLPLDKWTKDPLPACSSINHGQWI